MSRFLLDFYRVLETLEKHGVTFVSIAQNFDTPSPIRRVLQSMLMSFAEFEREQIAATTALARLEIVNGSQVLLTP